jgi:DNA-directed RNA polymerase subunit H
MATKKNQILVPDHVYVPKHEIISKSEAEEVLKKYNCKPTELPGESLYYRYVVEI